MSYAPYCVCCGAKAHWSCDFDTSDYGYEVEGIIGVYTCSNEECGAVHEIIDFFIDEEKDQRVVKYSCFDDEYESKEDGKKMISACVYCSSALEVKKIAPTSDVYGIEFECDGVTTTLECSHCKTSYDVVDLYPVDDICIDNTLDIRDWRTIFIINQKSVD